MSFLSEKELNEIGFNEIGEDVLISDKASIYNPQNIKIGNRTRIDDFCILSAGRAGIELGNNIHVSCYTSLIGNELISIESFCSISGRVSIYSSSDDFLGNGLTNPTIPDKYRAVNDDKVIIKKHSIVGAGTVILPGSCLKEGVAVGSLSLVKGVCDEYTIYAGIPIEKKGQRNKDNLLMLEKNYLINIDNK